MILIETPRLLVRQLQPGDAAPLFAIFGRPEVTRWMGDGSPLTYAQCEQWIAVSIRNYATKGFGASAVVARASGQLAGICGIVYGPGRNEPEIIYGFDQPWWGSGVASEVVPPMLRYGVERCGLPRVMATIAPENLASRRVAEKAGMRFDREEIDPDDGLPMLVYYWPPDA
jgi:ribosomal-protein-alanine N-acetyltransferase